MSQEHLLAYYRWDDRTHWKLDSMDRNKDGKPVLAYEGGKFDPERACRLMGQYGVRNAFIPPTALKMMRPLVRIQETYGVRLRSVMS